MIAAPLGLLAAAEIGLRAVGHGRSTQYLIAKNFERGARDYLPNREFFQQFSTIPIDRIVDWDTMDYLIRDPKPENTFRIFIFGESAAYGAPYSRYSFSRYLEVMLRARYPGMWFEVCNTACSGMNSDVCKTIAAACEKRRPDLFLFYMGNNEGIGPYGQTTPFAHNRALAAIQSLLPLDLIQLHIQVSGLRLLQWPFLEARNRRLVLEDSAYQSIPPDAYQQAVCAHFQRNIEDTCGRAARRRIPVLLCTLARNLASTVTTPPSPASAPPENFLNAPIRRAATALQQAKDLQPFVRLVDVEAAFLQHEPPGTLPGYDLFTDPIHFNFDGDYLLAKTVFPHVVDLLPEALRTSPAEPLSQPECESRLGLTPAMKLWVMGGAAGSALVEEAGAHQQAARIKQLQQEAGDDLDEAILAGFKDALETNPDDYALQVDFLKWALTTRRQPVPLDQARQIVAQFPYRRAGHRLLAVALRFTGSNDAAVEHLRTTLALYPDDLDARRQLNGAQ